MENNDIVSSEVIETPEVTETEVIWELTLDELLSELLPKEEIPNEPTFSDTAKVEEEVVETNNAITEQELEELENEVWAVIEELEAEVAEANSNTEKIKWELSTQIDELSNKLTEAQKTNSDVESAWQKVMSHPVIGKLAMDLVQWKEIDVPKILEEKLAENIASMSDITTVAPVSIETKKQSIWQRLWSMRTL